MNEGDLLTLLAKRYAEPRFAFLPHLRSGTGSNFARTIDALAMALWPSDGLELHAFEIKCSRSDWIKECRTPDKADKFFRFVHRFWLVAADDTIVQPGELPANWGLMVPARGPIRVKTQAPKQEPTPFPLSMLAAILRCASQRVEGMVSMRELRKQVSEARANEEEQCRRIYSDRLDRAKSELASLRKTVDDFEKASGVRLNGCDGGPIGAAVKCVLGDAERPYLNRLRHLEQAIARIQEDLGREVKALASEIGEMGQ